MRGAVLRWAVAAFFSVGLFSSLSAEELAMPFSCNAAGGEVQVLPAKDTSYIIVGHRDEQPFVACGNAGATCETMMVHRFTIVCDGQNVAWWRIANAAKAFAAPLPAGLPHGFAPVSTMSGRFVLPSLTRSTPSVTRVAMQDLSPDSVIDRSEEVVRADGPTWVTEIRADAAMAPSASGAFRVAGSLISVLALLLGASMVAAGRWHLPAVSTLDPTFLLRALRTRSAHWATETVNSFRHHYKNYRSAHEASHAGGAGGVHELLSAAQTRYAAAEHDVNALMPDVLLRDVLNSELHQIHNRIVDVERQAEVRMTAKSMAILRSVLRDLDRVQRISQSSGQPGHEQAQSAGIPQSVAEAYRVLGMNSEAAPAVAKKLVDALRMSWHPDHARDEADRLRREGRMKQINAAWDLIKDRRAAA